MKFIRPKALIFSVLILAVVFLTYHWHMLSYLLMQGKGQLQIITKTVSIESVLEQDTLTESAEFYLKLVPEIKTYAEQELGLEPGDNYTTYFDQKGKPILWALTACPPYSLKPYRWEFPILGALEYKGYFDKSAGMIEAERLKQQGLETDLGEVSAWSTLGILSDPILSSMLELDTGRFVRLLIHELTHATVYISDDAVFNENLATYVGDQGALKFLKQKFGSESGVVQSYSNTLEDIQTFSDYTNSFSKSLKQFYSTLPPDSNLWHSMKSRMFQAYKNQLFLLPLNDRMRYKKLSEAELNNTFFTGFLMYHNQQDSIDRILMERYEGKIKNWMEELKD